MYRIFCESVDNFFCLNEEGIGKNEYRLNMALPIKAMAHIDLYNTWKEKNNKNYKEVKNLLYEINVNKDQYPLFDTFARDLWGHGYEAEELSGFDKDTINEQLKLINTILKLQYWN